MRIVNDVQQAESRNGQLRPRNWRLKEEKVSSSLEYEFYIAKRAVRTAELAFERRKGAIKSGVRILRPSRSSDLRDKLRT